VAIAPMDWRFGPSHRAGAVAVGIVVHSDSRVAGHGPGVTPLLASPARAIRPVYAPNANIAVMLSLRRRIPALLPRRGAGSLLGERAGSRHSAAHSAPRFDRNSAGER
jgi:hypothetical protein